jgi:DNA-binding GntR family transcriptional regulator
MSDFKSIGGTVRARAANELRDRILTGRLRPGARLDLDEITREFGTSRTPVREALLELSYEGLVNVTPRSGITVIGITPEDAVDNFAVLATLSGKAAEWATARITPEERENLRILAEAVADADDVVAANWRFHRAVNLASGSRRLLTYLRQAVRVVPTSYFELFPEQVWRSRADHAVLLDALDRGDGVAARTLAEAHVINAGAALGDWLRARTTELPTHEQERFAGPRDAAARRDSA